MTETIIDMKQWRSHLAGLTRQLGFPAACSDPLLWAVACSIESAESLLCAYEHQRNGSTYEDARDALLEAVGSARAAIGAATYAAQEQHR
jgi:hypothetical protein